MPIISGGGGGAAFNGGTITQPLVIAPADPSVRPLEIRLPATASANGDYAFLVTSQDLTGATRMHAFDVYGGFKMLTTPSLGGRLIVENADASGLLLWDPNSDSQMKLNTGTKLNIRNAANASRLESTDTGLGFFGSSGVAQQTLTSGTATPEQIALALEASSLMTGS